MNPEQIAKLLDALIADYYALDGMDLADDVSGGASSFHAWVLRHALTQMLLKSEELAVARSWRVADRVRLLALPEYTEWTDADAVHIRMRLIARAGHASEFRVYATLSGGRRGVSISSERSPVPSASTAVAGRTVVDDRLALAARLVRRASAHHAPALGDGIVHRAADSMRG